MSDKTEKPHDAGAWYDCFLDSPLLAGACARYARDPNIKTKIDE